MKRKDVTKELKNLFEQKNEAALKNESFLKLYELIIEEKNEKIQGLSYDLIDNKFLNKKFEEEEIRLMYNVEINDATFNLLSFIVKDFNKYEDFIKELPNLKIIYNNILEDYEKKYNIEKEFAIELSNFPELQKTFFELEEKNLNIIKSLEDLEKTFNETISKYNNIEELKKIFNETKEESLQKIKENCEKMNNIKEELKDLKNEIIYNDIN